MTSQKNIKNSFKTSLSLLQLSGLIGFAIMGVLPGFIVISMNQVTFHNRGSIWEEHQIKKGSNKCTICSFQYSPGYTKRQNAFVMLACKDHLAHRQCLVQTFPRLTDADDIDCYLCRRVQQFDESEKRVQRQQYLKDYWTEYFENTEDEEYGDILKAVEKTGRYIFK